MGISRTGLTGQHVPVGSTFNRTYYTLTNIQSENNYLLALLNNCRKDKSMLQIT